MTTKLRALRAFRFGGEWIQLDDVIECDEKATEDLLAWRWAEPADNATAGLIRIRPVTERAPNWVTRK